MLRLGPIIVIKVYRLSRQKFLIRLWRFINLFTYLLSYLLTYVTCSVHGMKPKLINSFIIAQTWPYVTVKQITFTISHCLSSMSVHYTRQEIYSPTNCWIIMCLLLWLKALLAIWFCSVFSIFSFSLSCFYSSIVLLDFHVSVIVCLYVFMFPIAASLRNKVYSSGLSWISVDFEYNIREYYFVQLVCTVLW